MNAIQLEELKARICDDYCKWPSKLDDEYLEEICDDCPLNELEADDEG